MPITTRRETPEGGRIRPPEQLITRQQAAQRAAISLRHFERLIARGEGPSIIRLGERRIAISESDFTVWIASRRRAAPGAAAA